MEQTTSVNYSNPQIKMFVFNYINPPQHMRSYVGWRFTKISEGSPNVNFTDFSLFVQWLIEKISDCSKTLNVHFFQWIVQWIFEILFETSNSLNVHFFHWTLQWTIEIISKLLSLVNLHFFSDLFTDFIFFWNCAIFIVMYSLNAHFITEHLNENSIFSVNSWLPKNFKLNSNHMFIVKHNLSLLLNLGTENFICGSEISSPPQKGDNYLWESILMMIFFKVFLRKKRNILNTLMTLISIPVILGGGHVRGERHIVEKKIPLHSDDDFFQSFSP